MERKLNVAKLESCLNNVLGEITAMWQKLISVLSGSSVLLDSSALLDSSVCPHILPHKR